jgi:RHS repeat-associated protein
LKKTNSSGSTYYFWDGNHTIAEYGQRTAEAKLSWSKSRVYLGSRILTTFVPETSEGQFSERAYYHHPDRLGVRLITNSADSTATEQVTLPFGTLISSRSADTVDPVFTTYDRSSNTGLDHASSREYDSKERFIQVDPIEMFSVDPRIPQSLNLYAYVGNDPLNRIDSSGTVPDGPIGGGWFFSPAQTSKQAAAAAIGGFAGGPVWALAGWASETVNDFIDNTEAIVNGSSLPWLEDQRIGPFFDVNTTDPTYSSSLNLSTGEWVSSETVTESIAVSYGSVYSGGVVTQTTTVTATNYSNGTSTVTITNPDGTTMVRQTNSDGSRTETVYDANGNVVGTPTQYDPNGNVVTVSSGGGGSGCTTQDNSKTNQKTRRHNAKDTESGGC